MHFPPHNLQKDPCATFCETDDVLLEVHNWKGECCAWSLVATTSHILALKLTASLTLLIRSISLFISNPYLTSLDSACISFTLAPSVLLGRAYYRVISLWFHKCLLMIIMPYWRSCIADVEQVPYMVSGHLWAKLPWSHLRPRVSVLIYYPNERCLWSR
jgi:hypothetical protein